MERILGVAVVLGAGCMVGDGEQPPGDEDTAATGDTAESEPTATGGDDTGDEPDDAADDPTPEDDSGTGGGPDDGSTGGDSDDSDDDSTGDGPDTGGQTQGGGNVGLCDDGGPALDGLRPLTDLTGTYQGFAGCLYPGSNQHPLPHPSIEPIDGLIGVGSIGMSNAAQEWTYFLDNVATPGPSVVMFNAAQGGQTSAAWADPNGQVWSNFAQAATGAGLSDDQLQVVWVKSALSHNSHASLEEAAMAEKEALEQVLHNLADKHPSVRIAYLTSRAYGGYGCGLSPEPAAFAHGFAIKWLIEEQIGGMHDDLPFLAWGPYIWADGATPRSDGHAWFPEDFGDGCHPNQQGRQKVADLMQQFFTEEAPWYAQ